ncbi:MaoC/PaaZ C-terminal domain-containing protein [Glaciecola sp. 1036]|uniref:MaoC/PaaZ C-terminal domain-containing protein n=1 Tax=Alteromonadaceae TaxID=72275 RepID=UPI003D05D44F
MNITQVNIGDSFTSQDWIVIAQAQINAFAEATGDYQWIHLDKARCEKESPFKTTIAHGFLTVSLLPQHFAQLVQVDETTQTVINYGVNNLRFLEPVREGKGIKYHFSLKEKQQKSSGILYCFDTQVEVQCSETPAMIGEFLMLLVQ